MSFLQFAHIDLPFCIELYTRAITININEFSSTQISQEEKKKLSEDLCTRFLRLAELIPMCPGIKKECILTAFTLYPTNDLLKQIKMLSGFTIKEEVLSDDENAEVSFLCLC